MAPGELRRKFLRGLILACSCLLLLAATAASSAAAATTRQPISEFGEFQNPGGVAVDPQNGDIYVIDVGAEQVQRFDSSLEPKPFPALGGAYLDAAGGGECPAVPSDCDQTPQDGFSFDEQGAAQIAVDRSGSALTEGDIYVTDSLHHKLDVFASDGTYLGQLSAAASESFGEVCGVAVEPGGVIDVSDVSHGAIYRFDPSANPPLNSDAIGKFDTSEPCALASGAGGVLFVAQRFGQVLKLDSTGTTHYGFGPNFPRGLAIEPVSGNLLTTSLATAYEYNASGDEEANLVSTFGAERFDGTGGIAVAPDGSRAYVSDFSSKHVEVFGPTGPPVAPQARLAPYEALSTTAVRLIGFVNPRASQTSYRFEYGLQDCAAASCHELPSGGAVAVGDGADPVRVWQEATGLQPGTTYHFRLVAESEAGTTTSEDGTFSTPEEGVAEPCPNQDVREQQRAEFLPDCRAFERVSTFDPATRNGADVLPNSQHTRSASDGNAFEFSSVTGVGDAQSLPVSTDYMSQRRPGEGWVVHGITPPQRSMSILEFLFGLQPRYLGEFSPDLSRGVFLSDSALTAEGENVDEDRNLYLRNDLLTPGASSSRLLSDAYAPIEVESTYAPVLAGASADLSHVLFESSANLTPEAAGLGAGSRLYEWVDGEVHMVGALPASEGGGPIQAEAGRGASRGNYTTHVISEDGSRVVFTASLEGFGSGGSLYLRNDRGTRSPEDDTVVKVNRSERGGGTPEEPQPATFWTATPDLSQIFFTTSEALTDGVSTESPGSTKLYRYSADAPAGERLTLLSVDSNPEDGITDESDGAIGASANGEYVYFIASNQLLPGGPIGNAPRIYVWHDGTVREVAAINSETEKQRILGGSGWQESSQWARVTPEGSHLIFLTEGTGEAGEFDHGESCPALSSPRCLEVYVYTAGGGPGRLQCASCPQDGQIPGSDASFDAHLGPPLLRGDQHLNRPISDDGRYVFFSSAQRLDPADRNDTEDAYRFDTATGLVQLLTPAEPGVNSYFLEASPSGRDAFVATRSELVTSDRDGALDVYDARVGGGFSETTAEESACTSEQSCRPAEPGGSVPAPPASASSLSSPPLGKHNRHHRRHHQPRHRRHRGGHRRHQNRQGGRDG